MKSFTGPSDPALDFKAEDMMREGLLQARARVAPPSAVVTHVWGPCPRCKHPIDVLVPYEVVNYEEQARSDVFFRVLVTCACEADSHPWKDGAGGCGVSFWLNVPFSGPKLF